MKKILLPILGIIAIAATGCSGSTSSATPSIVNAPTTGYPVSAPPGTTTSPASKPGAVFKISVPASVVSASSSTRHPQYVSPNTKSVQISLTSVNGSSYSLIAPEAADISSVANGGTCTGTTTLTCTVTFSTLPIGTDGFTVNTYSAPAEGGSILATNTTTASIAVATVTSVPLALQGIINTLAVAINTPNLVPGTSSTRGVTVSAYDPSGAQIIGSAPYNNGPIVMTTDDTYSAISGLSNLASPGTESLSYNGTLIPSNTEHVIATVGAITASAPILVTVTAESLAAVGLPLDATFAGSGPYAEASGTDSTLVVQATQSSWGTVSGHPFTVVSNTCGANDVVTTGPGVDQFTLKSGGTAATCAITIAGGGAQASIVNVSQAAGSNGFSSTISSITRK